MIIKNPIVLVSLILFSFGFFIADAYAYLDPGSASLFIQIIVGALVGVGITIRIYWYALKEKISIHKSKN